MLKRWLCFFLLVPTLALAAEFTEGKEYEVVSGPSITVAKNNQPLVTEFFSFGCPWCYKIEAPLHDWSSKIGNTVKIEKVPVVFKPDWELYAKAYYTAKALALTNKMTPALFKAVQSDKQHLATPEAMTHFFVTHGVDKEIAKSAFAYSPTIDLQVKQGMMLMAEYQVTAIPTFIINNKYKTDLKMAGSPERLFAVVDYLVRKG